MVVGGRWAPAPAGPAREWEEKAMQVIYRVFFAAALLAALSSFARADITFGQVDTFQTGDPMGWSQGGPSPNQPTVIPTGGPAGTGDEYLQNVSSGGAGPGSKQIMLNSAQWTGSYVAAGVTRIDLEMADFSAKPLSMRVLIEGGPGGSDFVSSAAFPLPADKAWHQATFDLTSAALQEVEGSDTLAAVLGSVTQIRLLSATSPSSHGDAVAATVGFDDIRALTLPGDANHDGAVNFNDLLV